MDIFEKISHLPDPLPVTNQDHYKSFSESYAKPTTEEHRPSLKEGKKKDHGMPFSPSSQYATNTDTFLQCLQCGRWRCVNGKRRLTDTQKEQLRAFLDSHHHVCGATFSPENDDDDLDVLNSTFVNGGLTCASLMEKPSYVACKDLVCFQCGTTFILFAEDVLQAE